MLRTLGESMKRILLVVALAAFPALAQACAPSGPSIATAIAQTAAARPTDIPLPTPTVPPAPTATPEPSPTPLPSPTPDLRVIDTDPRNLLLIREDLPPEAKYFLPNSTWISPHRNSEVVSGWGVEEGRTYLEQTGRIDGWWVSFERGTSTVNSPEEIYDNVVLYRTAEGAMLVMEEFSSCKNPDNEYSLVDPAPAIGDATNACVHKEMQSSGENRVTYRIEFVTRNVYHAVVGWGWEREVKGDYIADVARVLLAKVEQAPLASEVTFTP
jgi:hypothetical protein